MSNIWAFCTILIALFLIGCIAAVYYHEQQ